MAHIVPSISYLKVFKSFLEQGHSVKTSMILTSEQENSEFSLKVFQVSGIWEQKQSLNAEPFGTHYQKSLIELLKMGCEGSPIYEPLQELEGEMELEFDRQWKLYLEQLPMRLSLPLLLFFFPAYVILLFGPLIIQFLNEVQT